MFANAAITKTDTVVDISALDNKLIVEIDIFHVYTYMYFNRLHGQRC